VSSMLQLDLQCQENALLLAGRERVLSDNRNVRS
jgi:hypothetical protein